MEVADFKQTEFFASELTELHQLVTETAQTEAANQSKPKKSDIFSLHTNEQYANALKRVIVFTKSRASGMLAEIIKISSTKTEQLTYELIVANIYVADVLLTFYLYQGWLDQLTEKLSEKIIDRLRIIGDDVRPLKNETVFDVAYQTMISQWSTLVKLLCIEKHFRSIWTYFFGYWKDPNTENFTSRVKLLQYMQFSKAETSEARVVEGVLRTIAQSVKSAKKVEMKADIMELLINLVFSLPENSFGKELHTVRGMVNSYFSKSQQLEVLGARFDAAVHLKTNLSEIQPIMKTINGLNDINAKTEPIFSYIEALCTGLTENKSAYSVSSFASLPIDSKKRISPFRVLPLKQFSEKYINALLTVVINCPPKVEKEEVERRANVVLFCAAHNFPVTYNLLDTFFEDKEDKLSLAVLYHSIQLIVDNRFLWINVSAEKEHRIKKRVLGLGKRQFNDLYNSTYEVVKQIDEQTSSQRPLAIPEHVKEFMAKGCGHDTYIKSTLEKAVIRWKEIQEGNAGALNSKIIKETSVEVVDILKRWGNEIDVEGIEKEKSIVKNLLLSEIPDDLITPKDDVKEKVVDRRKKVIKDEKTKEKIDDDTILLVQLIRYLSHYAKLYIINTQKLHMPSFFAFISSKSDYLANAVMETIYRMVYSNEEFRTLVVWDLMKMFLELIDADVPYQNTMEFVDSVMCLWTVLRVEETNRSQINEEIKSKKNKKSKKPVVVYTEHLSEYIEAIITVLQQRFDQSVRIQAPELFTFLYFSSLKEFDNTVWKTLHQHRQYIEQLSRYWFILMTTKIPDSLINIKKQLPVITQEQVQVVNQNLLSMDYIQTYLIMKLLRNTPGTTVITDKVAKIVRRQLGKELTNETRYRLLNIYFSTLSLQNTSNKTQEELNAIYTLENPEFKHLGDVSLPLIRPLLKELIENTSYQDSNESKIIWLFSCMHHDVFYFFVQELKNVVLPLFSSEKSSIEKRRELMLNSMRMLNNALMKDYHTLFTTEISTQLILNILSIINETFSHVKLLWPTFNITSTTRTSFDSASNFPAYFAQNFVSLLYYFCKTIQKMPHFHLEKPTNSVLPVSLELHFLLWPLDQRTDICRYCIENFITPQMNNNPLCNIISLTALEAVSAIFSLSPLSLTEKFFIKPKHIVELEKMHSGILKWIIRYHPDLVFSPKNPDIENLTESTVVIRAISSVYSRIFLPTYNDSGVDAIDLEHVKYLEQGGLQETIENDPIFIENLKKFGGSILHHALITLMADTEEIRLCAFNVISWLLPIHFGLSTKFDQTLHDQIIKNRLSITTTIEQNRLLAATEIVRLCVKCCEPYARTVFYKGTLAGGGNKLSDIQKRWLVTYIINWLPFITLSKDFNDKEINRILSILVYDVTSVMKHNSNQAIAFWNRVCSKKPNEKDNVLVNEYSNYNIIFSFLKSELPKAKDSESFLIVFQALMKVDLKHTFSLMSDALSFNYSKAMMVSRGAYKEKFKGQFIAMSVLNDFFGEGILVENSGVHYMIIFSVLILYAVQEKSQVEIFYAFIKKLCYFYYDMYVADSNESLRVLGNKFWQYVVSLEIEPILNRTTLVNIFTTICELLSKQQKTKLLIVIKDELAHWACSGDVEMMTVESARNACDFYAAAMSLEDTPPIDDFVSALVRMRTTLTTKHRVKYTESYNKIIDEYIVAIIAILDRFCLKGSADIISRTTWVVASYLCSPTIVIDVYRSALSFVRDRLRDGVYLKIDQNILKRQLSVATNNNPPMYKGNLVMALRGLTDHTAKEVSAECCVLILGQQQLYNISFPRSAELTVPLAVISFSLWFCEKLTNLKLRLTDDWTESLKLLGEFVKAMEELKEPRLRDCVNYLKEIMEKDIKNLEVAVVMNDLLQVLPQIVSVHFATLFEIIFNECLNDNTPDILRDLIIRFAIFFAKHSEMKSAFIRMVSKKRDVLKKSELIFDLLNVLVKSTMEEEASIDLSYIDSYHLLQNVALHMFGISKDGSTTEGTSYKESLTSERDYSSTEKSVSSRSSGGRSGHNKAKRIKNTLITDS